MDAARTTLDETKRLADYHSALEILRQDVPGSACFRIRDLRRREAASWTPTANEAFFVMDMKWQHDAACTLAGMVNQA